MSTPLTDRITALTSQANAATGASDTTLSDAVGTLIAGFGKPELWKTVTLTETYAVQDVTTLGFWMSFLEIPQQDVLDGCVYFVRFIGNSAVRNYAVLFVIYAPNDAKTDLYSVCLRRNSGVQASLGSEKWAYADAGTIVSVYKIKGVF